MAIPDARLEQMFPGLSPAEIDRLRRFGTTRRYAAGELLFRAGDINSAMFVLISGSVGLSARDGLGHVLDIIELGPGGFLAEAGMLAGQPRLADARANSDTEVLLIPGDRLRTVLIAEAEIGERIMRALLLRRAGLIETGGGGPVLIGPAIHPDLIRLQGFLARNASPHRVLDPTADHEAGVLLEHDEAREADIPLVVCPDGSVLKNPTEADLARTLGMRRLDHPGPHLRCRHRRGGAGRARDSRLRRLRRAVRDRVRQPGVRRTGGRERSHRELPRFPRRHLWAGPHRPGLRAGAEVRRRDRDPEPVVRLDCATHPSARDGGWPPRDGPDDRRGQRRALSAAPDPNLEAFEGRGVWYWASPIEAVSAAASTLRSSGAGIPRDRRRCSWPALPRRCRFSCATTASRRACPAISSTVSRRRPTSRFCLDGDYHADRRTGITAGPGALAARYHGGRNRTADLPSFPLRRCRARDGVAARLRYRAGPGGLRAHGAAGSQAAPAAARIEHSGRICRRRCPLWLREASGRGDRRGRRGGGAAPHRARGRSLADAHIS